MERMERIDAAIQSAKGAEGQAEEALASARQARANAAEIEAMFGVSRQTVYKAVER